MESVIIVIILATNVYINCVFPVAGDGFYLADKMSMTYNHVWLYEQTRSFEFALRTCKGASIYLGEKPLEASQQDRGYEIHISGDPSAQSEIRR